MKGGYLSYFQCGFCSSHSTRDHLKVTADWIASAFNKYGATWAVALDISKGFYIVWQVGLFQKHSAQLRKRPQKTFSIP